MIGRLEDGDSLVDDGVVLAKRGNMVHGQGKAWAPDAKQEVLSHANELFAKLGEAILKDASLAASEWNLAPWGGSGGAPSPARGRAGEGAHNRRVALPHLWDTTTVWRSRRRRGQTPIGGQHLATGVWPWAGSAV